MYVVETVDDLWNHIAYVMAYAPDSFPYRDFLAPDQQMNLDRAFEQLRHGVSIAYPGDSFSDRRAPLIAILDESYSAFRAGKRLEACHLLNQFQDQIFEE